MKKKFKPRKPLQIPISGDGGVCDVINQFVNHLNYATNGNTVVDWDFAKNEIVIYFESPDHPSIKNDKPPIKDEQTKTKNERPEINLNNLYSGGYVKKLYCRDQREPGIL